MNLRAELASRRVLPVLTIRDEENAVPLARALQAGGLSCLEVTLRTPTALAAIARIRSELPDVVVGAGTVLDPEDLVAAHEAGAQFAVSPGLDDTLAEAAHDRGVPFLPGVMTPSEVLAARRQGWRLLKLFPAEAAGGIDLLRALGGPFVDVEFCPTGGITRATAGSYLERDNVVCIGGSWMAPEALIDAADWAAITALSREQAP